MASDIGCVQVQLEYVDALMFKARQAVRPVFAGADFKLCGWWSLGLGTPGTTFVIAVTGVEVHAEPMPEYAPLVLLAMMFLCKSSTRQQHSTVWISNQSYTCLCSMVARKEADTMCSCLQQLNTPCLPVQSHFCADTCAHTHIS